MPCFPATFAFGNMKDDPNTPSGTLQKLRKGRRKEEVEFTNTRYADTSGVNCDEKKEEDRFTETRHAHVMWILSRSKKTLQMQRGLAVGSEEDSTNACKIIHINFYCQYSYTRTIGVRTCQRGATDEEAKIAKI